MRVVLAYTMLVPEVTRALDASEVDWEGVDVSDSDEAYWELLDDLWSYQADFAIVEHDVVVQSGTLKSFEECPEPWCAAPYPYFVGMYAGLGCVRFRSEVMKAVPGLLGEVAIKADTKHPSKHWCALDSRIQNVLQRHRFGICRHDPVLHLGSREPAHGCR